jgi:hypothetical protein
MPFIGGKNIDPGFGGPPKTSPIGGVPINSDSSLTPWEKKLKELTEKSAPSSISLTFFPTDTALKRLVDFDRVTAGLKPVSFPELDGIDPARARSLYGTASLAMTADLMASVDDIAIQKSRSIVSFARGLGRLDGLESLFMSAMSILQRNGSAGLSIGYDLLGQVGPLGRLGGGFPAGLFFDSQKRSLMALSLDAMNGLLFGKGMDDAGVRPGRDISSVASGAAGAFAPVKHGFCVSEYVVAGGIVGALGGPIGAGAGELAGVALGEYMCSGAYKYKEPPSADPNGPAPEGGQGPVPAPGGGANPAPGPEGGADPKPAPEGGADPKPAPEGGADPEPQGPPGNDPDDEGYQIGDSDGAGGDPTDTPHLGAKHASTLMVDFSGDPDGQRGDYSLLPGFLGRQGVIGIDWKKIGTTDPIPGWDGRSILDHPHGPEILRLIGEGMARTIGDFRLI